MSLDLLHIRPRFKKITPETSEELLNRLKGLIQSNSDVAGKVVHHHVNLTVSEANKHFWSPHLSLSFEDTEEGTKIRGLYGPSPNIWLLFMFVYFFLGFIALVILIVGLSRYNLGLSSYILWFIPFILGGIAVLYISGKTGKRLGRPQIMQIHELIKPLILSKAVDLDDW